MRKPNGWKKRWADAKAAGPEAVAELSAELRFVMASAERRRQEEARKHLESLGNCTDCGAWSKRLQVTQGCARKLTARVLYVSPDGRAVVWSYDSDTKYLDASLFSADSESEIGVNLFLSESTLRPARSKKPGEVRLKLPKGPKGSWWLYSLSAGRYDGVIHMWRYDPEETREHR